MPPCGQAAGHVSLISAERIIIAPAQLPAHWPASAGQIWQGSHPEQAHCLSPFCQSLTAILNGRLWFPRPYFMPGQLQAWRHASRPPNKMTGMNKCTEMQCLCRRLTASAARYVCCGLNTPSASVAKRNGTSPHDVHSALCHSYGRPPLKTGHLPACPARTREE